MTQRHHILLAALCLLVAVPAGAQTDDTALDADSAPAAGPLEAAAEPLPVSDKDQSIYIIQKRTYSKSGKFEMTPVFFTSLNNKFVGHLGAGVSAAYHVRENFAVEVFSSVPYAIWSFYSALVYEVYDYESLTPEAVDLKQLTYFGSLSLQFSALYGKMEFYGFLIGYDFYVSGGFGVASTLEICVPNKDGCGDDLGIGRGTRPPLTTGDKLKLTGNLAGGMRFFFRDWAGLRFEVRDVSYSDRAEDAGEITTDIRNNIFLVVGLTLLI